MRKIVEKYFEDRIKGSVVDLENYFRGEKYLFEVNKNDGYKYHIVIFPNIIWDGNLIDKHIVFDGYLDWLISTINYLKNRKDIKLFIKAHLGELVYCKKTDKIVDLIKRHINIFEFKNLILIPPEKKVDTYAFLKSGIDLVLVYD